MKSDIINLIVSNNINNILLEKNVVEYVDKLISNCVIITQYDSNRLVGFCAFYANNIKDSKSFLSMICVDQRFKGKGIGGLLMNYWLDYARRSGFKDCYLEVNKTNKLAISIYKKKNFIEYSDLGNSIIMYYKKG